MNMLSQVLGDVGASAKLSAGDGHDTIGLILKAVREHLGMEVAFASRITNGQVVIQHANNGGASLLQVGDIFATEQSYCQRIIDGRLPSLIPDTADFPETAKVDATTSLPIGSHLGVPLRMTDGSIYGTFCCFSRQPDPSLNDRDLHILQAFADVVAPQMERGFYAEQRREQALDRLRDVLVSGGPEMHLQPIVNLTTRRTIGFEALARFPDRPMRTTDQWFDDARAAEATPMLELAALRSALLTIGSIPDDCFLAVNLSPETLLHPDLEGDLSLADKRRLVIEITERPTGVLNADLLRACDRLRERFRLALDDIGIGWSDLQRIASLDPDFLKIDISLVRDLDRHPHRRALIRALVAFAADIGATVIAEGIEQAHDFATLIELGVTAGQGFLLAKPMPADEAIAWSRGSR